MASRKRDLPTPPSAPDKPKPTAAPKSGYQWLYNMNLKKWEEVKIGSSAAQGPTYYQGAGSTTTTTAPTTTPGGQPGGREATPAERAAAIEYSRSRIEAATTPERPRGPKPPPPAQTIDWEGIVTAIQKDALIAAKEMYGGFYAIIEQDEEIKSLVIEATLNGWTDKKFKAKLIETNWYKTTKDTARKFDIEEQLDPQTIKDKINDQALAIQNAALEKGARLSNESAQDLARNALRLGWSALTLSNAIGAEIFKTTPTTELSRGYIGQTARSKANQYGIRMSDSSILSWTEKIMTGKESDQTFEDWLMSQARTLYPALASGFDRGLSFSDMTDPYAEQAATLLEIPASSIDFADPKFAAAFTSKDKDGNQTQMTYGDWMDYLKTNPEFGWEYTDNAKNSALDLVGRVSRLFGAG